MVALRIPVLFLTLSALSVAAAEGVCDGACAGTYDKCIGRDIKSLKYCCDPNDECIKFSKWYGECRPKSNPRFDADWLGVTADCRLCGAMTRQPGEFNFQDNVYCNIERLGNFNLRNCYAICANGPYVACDRPAAPPETATACWGYTETFEGGCFMRVNPESGFESWLSCSGNDRGVLENTADEGPAALSIESMEIDISADTVSAEEVEAQRRLDLDVLG